MIRISILLSVLCAILCLASREAPAVVIDTVPVGNPGNGPDPAWLSTLGALGNVDYQYQIGTFEVTNSQYVEFLNAKANSSDPLALYDVKMGTDLHGGISRVETSGNFVYSVRPNMGNKPVNFVTFWDAERFANWMHNGQGSSDTESGSYTLLGGTPTPTNSATAHLRNAGATWVLPTENEWNKAAFYDPRSTAEGGPPADSHYWLYPTGPAHAYPDKALANATGDVTNPSQSLANYWGYANWNGSTDGNVTTVGGAGPTSASYYGTFDQAGNVAEWSTVAPGDPALASRPHVFLGGAYLDYSSPQLLTAQGRGAAVLLGAGPTFSVGYVGFRLALVPEPSSLLLGILALTGFAVAARRYRV